MKKSTITLSFILMIGLMVGCGSGTPSGTPSGTQGGNSNIDAIDDSSSKAKTAIMDATNAMVTKFNLSSGSVVSDNSWHFAYQRYVGFKTNSGTSAEGENNITVCVAKTYPALYDTNGEAVEGEFTKLTPDNTLADFESVTSGAHAGPIRTPSRLVLGHPAVFVSDS